MDNGNHGDLVAQERAAKVTWWLAHGETMTTAQVAEMTGLSRQGAWKMMVNLARVIPICGNDDDEWEAAVMQEAQMA